MRLQGVWRGLAASLALAGLAACGTSKTDGGAAPVTIAPVSTAVPTTPVATVTVTAPSTTVPTTTVAPTTAATTVPATLPTTTAATLPQPQAPPNPNAIEPAVQIGTIAIPKLQLLHSMWEGITDSTLNRGPGHWPGTAMPGQIGNVVLGGHRVSHDRPFRHIDELVPGDQIILTTLTGQFTYIVTGSQVVTPHDVWIVNQTPAHTLTLFACHPPGSVRERYVVFAKLAGT
jgi:sortase A